MRIKELFLNNWQVIRSAEFKDLSDFVVIAGPNGVGKTKIKEAIVKIFRDGRPPQGSNVVLEATNDEEKSSWKTSEFSLPQSYFASIFHSQNKKLRTKSKLIQINSNRSIDSLQFQQLTFTQIGDPAEEVVNFDYGINDIKDRFSDICRTLHRLKSKEVTAVYREYNLKLKEDSEQVEISKLKDPTAKYVDIFGKLLYPKKMFPIDIDSTTIFYLDEDGVKRQFSDLSSGEKEVVILMFDLLAQNPSDCIILIDEPEVHLHPELTFRLIKVLKAIGERNQIFLFTHSADIIGNSLDTGVYFIKPKTRVNGNQVVKIDEKNLEELNTIPNIRQTIGMVSVGKKLLFIEGNNNSIDRNVFATIAKASKVDLSIIPSESCSNINNLSLVSDTLEKGIFGVELFMVRDRDGLTDEQIINYELKSKGKLIFLPFYHIENSFLKPKAIHVIAQKILLSKAPSLQQIEEKLIELAFQQIYYGALLYVKSEIYFQAGNFDVTPSITINSTTTVTDLAMAINQRKDLKLKEYSQNFSYKNIEERINYWKNRMEDSLKSGWSNDARKIFIGKRLLKEIQNWIFSGRNISLWEHIISTDSLECDEACSELVSIINRI